MISAIVTILLPFCFDPQYHFGMASMDNDVSPPENRKSSTFPLVAAITLLLVAAVAGGAWFAFLRPDPHEFKYGFYNPAEAAPDFQGAVDQHGNPFSLEDYRGKLVFVYFGYTHCPDACPATLDEFMEVKENLGEDAEDVAFVMVTVDPARDTPERLAEYLDFWDPEFYGVSMSQEDTDAVTRSWIINYSYQDKNSQGGYLVDHEVSSFVIDKDGNKRLTYPLGSDTETMAKDARYLLDE
jgi:protein SCO1/2